MSSLVLSMVVPGLKARYIDVYLPSEEAKQEWEEEAKKAGLSLSKFIFCSSRSLSSCQRGNSQIGDW